MLTGICPSFYRFLQNILLQILQLFSIPDDVGADMENVLSRISREVDGDCIAQAVDS